MRRTLSRLFGLQANTPGRGRWTKKAPPQLALEALEDRWMPATLQIINGELTYTAGAGIANNLRIETSGNNYVFTDTKETISAPGLTGSGTNSVSFPTAFVGSMRINLGDQADTLIVDDTFDSMIVQAGDGNDTIVIEETDAAITILAGAGNDTIDVGRLADGSLSGIDAAVTVDGEAGTDVLRVNDPASGADRKYTVTATQVTPAGGFDVNYAGFERLTVTAGALSDTFTVRATAAGTTTTLNAGGSVAGNTFNVGSTANTLDDIRGHLSLVGGPASIAGFGDRVNLFDQGSSIANSYAVRANSVARSGGVVVAYSEVGDVELHAGSAADSVVVLGTSAGTPVRLNMGDGNDVVNLATRTGSSLDGLLDTVTVNGQEGTDAIFLNDQTEDQGNAYIAGAGDVIRNGTKVLNYFFSESVTLNAGDFADTVTVTGPITLKLGDGDDTVVSGNGTFTSGGFSGGLTIDGQAGSDQLTLNDKGVFAGREYIITANTVQADVRLIAYTGLENLTVNAADFDFQNLTGTNIIRVKSTSIATTINGARGLNDFFIVGNDGNSLDAIQAPLTINGQDGSDQLVLNDQGEASANSYTITSTSVARPGAALITYSLPATFNSKPKLILNAGAGNDTVAVRSTATTTPVTLNMGAGNDTVTLGNGPLFMLNGIASLVTVNGQAGVDSIVLNDVDGGFLPIGGRIYTVTGAGVIRSNLQILRYDTAESLDLRAAGGNDSINVASTLAATPVIVRAGFGNDVLRVGNSNASAVLGAVTLDGQGGTDTLDYFFFTAPVRVNLAAGTATGVTGGVSNIENVLGGSANDILIGNDQANDLRGESGRDILIGRGGADRLLGQSGDDILIGSSTVHDLNAVALEQIMSEWGRTDLSGTPQFQYAVRVLHLFGLGTGLNGTTRLNPSNVLDDGVADRLDGGTELDWFFQLGADTIAALEASERVN